MKLKMVKPFFINIKTPYTFINGLMKINKGTKKSGLVLINQETAEGFFRCVYDKPRMVAVVSNTVFKQNVKFTFSIDSKPDTWIRLFYSSLNCFVVLHSPSKESFYSQSISSVQFNKKDIVWKPIFNSNRAVKSIAIFISSKWLKEIGLSSLYLKKLSDKVKPIEILPLKHQTLTLLEQIHEIAKNPNQDLLLEEKLENHLWAISYNSLLQYRNLINFREQNTLEVGSNDLKKKISEVKKEIIKDFSKEKQDLDYWAKHVGTNRTKFQKVFKETYNISFYKFYQEARFNEALRLLESESFNINKIAVFIGYKNVGYFIKEFQKRFGLTPHEYRIEQGRKE